MNDNEEMKNDKFPLRAQTPYDASREGGRHHIASGLQDALEIIDKYKVETENDR